MDSLVIIGNCAAAVSAVEVFREHDTKTSVVIVSQEPYYAYYRMRLSHMLGKSLDVNKILLHEPCWYLEKQIDVLLGRHVVDVKFQDKVVILDDKTKLSYSKLLFANGSNPFKPPISGIDLKGVFTIRTVDNANELNSFTKNKENGIIIGGGVLGLEAAWSLAKNGKCITVIEGSPYILNKQLDETASNLLKGLGEEAGIQFVLDSQVEKISGQDTVSSVVLKDDRQIQTDFVVISAGVRPNINLLKNTPIKLNRGIIVDEYMQTSIDDVYAAGDVAEYNGNIFGIWPAAMEQGKLAGLNLSGVATPYNEIVPSNFIKVFNTDIFSAGDLCKDGSQEQVIEEYYSSKKIFKKIFFKNGSPVGAILLGDTKPAIKISKAIKNKKVFSKDIISGGFNKFLEQL